jgi:hypothetical protein
MRRARVLLLVAVPLVLLGGTAAFVFVRTERGLAGARTAAGERGRVGFEVRRLGGPTRGGGPGFEPVASAAGFSAGAFFEGQLYLTGPAGLHVYGPGGAKGLAGAGTVGLVRTYRVGTDLPAAALGPMAVARLRGESGPVLAIATAGEGVLLFSPGTTAEAAGSFRQIWASAAEMRDVTALLPLATGELLIGTRRAGLLIYSGAGGGGGGGGRGVGGDSGPRGDAL